MRRKTKVKAKVWAVCWVKKELNGMPLSPQLQAYAKHACFPGLRESTYTQKISRKRYISEFGLSSGVLPKVYALHRDHKENLELTGRGSFSCKIHDLKTVGI